MTDVNLSSTSPPSLISNGLVNAEDKPWYPAKVCTEAYFRRVVSATFTAYIAMRKASLPDVKTIQMYMSAGNKAKPNLSKIASVLVTDEFKEAMSQRGIEWTGKQAGITPEQSYALSIVLDPSSRRTFEARLKSAGITYTKWNAWCRQPLFAQAVSAITEGALQDNVGVVHTALVNKAISGDVRAMEFFYQISGRFDPAKEQTMNMNALLLSIIEVLTRRLGTQPELLEVIGNDLEGILASQTSSKSVPAINVRAYAELVDDQDVQVPKAPQPVVFELPNQSAFSFVKE